MPRKTRAEAPEASPAATAAPPPEPIDPFSCAACCAPGLPHAFRVKQESFCWDCFFDRPGHDTATFIVNPRKDSPA